MDENKTSKINPCPPGKIPCVQCHNKKKCLPHSTRKVGNRNSPGHACPYHKTKKKKCGGDACIYWISRRNMDPSPLASADNVKISKADTVASESQTDEGLNNTYHILPTPARQISLNTSLTNLTGSGVTSGSTFYSSAQIYVDSPLHLSLPETIIDNTNRTSNVHVPYPIQPTSLQHAMPHDPRIDMLPRHFLSRMLLFSDFLNIDKFLDLFVKEARPYGDRADPMNWELPAKFFSDYWFIVDMSDLANTNKWRTCDETFRGVLYQARRRYRSCNRFSASRIGRLDD